MVSQLAAEDYLSSTEELPVFAERASHFIAEINAVHPFREGNGRCQLTFLSILMELSGFEMDEDRLDSDAVMDAMIASFLGNNVPLADAIAEMAS